MKNGIQIEIQKNLTVAESKEAKDFANRFIKSYLDAGMKFGAATKGSVGTNGGWFSYYRRGTLGQRLSQESKLYFRRASKNRRIYQIVRGSELKLCPDQQMSDINIVTVKTKDGKYKRRYNTNYTNAKVGEGCVCPKCTAQLKVSNKYGDTPTEIYATIGDIKG